MYILNFLTEGFRSLALLLDSVAFSLLGSIYGLFSTIASLSLIDEKTVNSIINNMYVVVGIFAFFRIAVLLINAMITPDALAKQGAGLSKIAVNTVIMIVLLVFTPTLFELSRDVSKKIVDGHYVEKVFLNTDTNDANPSNAMERIAVGALITVNDQFLDTSEESKGKLVPNSDCTGDCEKAVYCLQDINGINYETDDNGDYVLDENGKKKKAFKGDCLDDNEGIIWSKLSDYNAVTKKKTYVYNYKYFILTIVGWAMAYVLLSFTFDVAKRMVELAILEILAPLFIATIVDPKSMQSGTFKKWLKTLGSSYVSLFIRQASVAIMLLCAKLLMAWTPAENANVGFFGKLIILLGVLIFAKGFPKWISNMVGLDGEAGLGGLGIRKKIADAALIGSPFAKKAGRVVAGAAAGAASMIARNRRNRNAQRKKVREDEGLTHGIKGRKKRQEFSARAGGYFAGRRQLHQARKDAYRKAGVGLLGKDANNTNKKGKPKSAVGRNLGQIGASLVIGAVTGGKAGLKANDIKGTMSGVKGTTQQYGQSLGFQGKTLSGALSDGLDKIVKKQENRWGTETQRFEARENAEKVEKTNRFRAAGTSYTHGVGENQIAVGVKEARQVMDAKLKGGASFEIKSDNDVLAKQFAVNQGSRSVERVTEIKEGKEVVTGYKFENADGSVVQKSVKDMETSCGGIMTPEGVANFLKSTYTAQQSAVETYNDNVQAQANAVSSYNQARTNAQNSAEQFNQFKSTNGTEINEALIAAGLSHGLSELGSNIISSIGPLGRAIEKLSADYESASGDARLGLQRQINLLSELKQSAESNKLFSESAATSREQLENITVSQQNLSSIVRSVDGYTEAEKIQTLSRKISDIDKKIEIYKKEEKKD